MYYLGLFRMPKSVEKQIIRIQRRFFWFGDKNKEGIPFVKWSTIHKPKEQGGLGYSIPTLSVLVFKIQTIKIWKMIFLENIFPPTKHSLNSVGGTMK